MNKMNITRNKLNKSTSFMNIHTATEKELKHSFKPDPLNQTQHCKKYYKSLFDSQRVLKESGRRSKAERRKQLEPDVMIKKHHKNNSLKFGKNNRFISFGLNDNLNNSQIVQESYQPEFIFVSAKSQ